MVKGLGSVEIGKVRHSDTLNNESANAKLCGQGCHIAFFLDESKAEDDLDRYYSETTCDGDADSIAFEVPKHWHKLHDEYMTVEEGELEFYLDGTTSLVKPGDPMIKIPRRAVHSIKWPTGKRATLRERTNPTGPFKQRFFEDMFGGKGFGLTMRAFADGDTYIPLPGNLRLLDEVFMFFVGIIASILYPRKEKPASKPTALDAKKAD